MRVRTVTGRAKYLGSVAEPCLFAETVRSLTYEEQAANVPADIIRDLHAAAYRSR